MFRTVRNATGIACIRYAFMPMQRRQLDEDRLGHPKVWDPDSGVHRVLQIFERDENGTISPELSYISIVGFTGALLGSLYGGLVESRFKNQSYIESNEATVYYSKKAANRELIDNMTLSFGKGAAKFGIRYAIFGFTFAGLSTIISRFRDKSGVLEYSLAGLITGSIYKFGLGPKGMISGGFFGCVIASFGGLCVFGLTKVFGVTMHDLHVALKQYYIYKDTNFHGASETQLEEPDIILDKFPKSGGNLENVLNDFDDIRNSSELKYSKNPIPKLDSKTASTETKTK